MINLKGRCSGMSIDFHSQENQSSYIGRTASLSWVNEVKKVVDFKGKAVADIGCGGGIYTLAMAMLGAESVTAVDYSWQQLQAAKENCQQVEKIKFLLGNALDTKLDDATFDIVLERAVIHHITKLETCFNEIYRILNENGTAIIQDRTPEDCLQKSSKTHIRGYFFEKFPVLINIETSRRYSSEQVIETMRSTGFAEIEEIKLWEQRKVYQNINELKKDLLERKGRSILHELNDQELFQLVNDIEKEFVHHSGEIKEQDRWTIWIARKKRS